MTERQEKARVVAHTMAAAQGFKLIDRRRSIVIDDGRATFKVATWTAACRLLETFHRLSRRTVG